MARITYQIELNGLITESSYTSDEVFDEEEVRTNISNEFNQGIPLARLNTTPDDFRINWHRYYIERTIPQEQGKDIHYAVNLIVRESHSQLTVQRQQTIFPHESPVNKEVIFQYIVAGGLGKDPKEPMFNSSVIVHEDCAEYVSSPYALTFDALPELMLYFEILVGDYRKRQREWDRRND